MYVCSCSVSEEREAEPGMTPRGTVDIHKVVQTGVQPCTKWYFDFSSGQDVKE
jgi:hypothetical protein